MLPKLYLLMKKAIMFSLAYLLSLADCQNKMISHSESGNIWVISYEIECGD